VYSKEQILEIKTQSGLAPYEKRLPDLTQISEKEHRARCPWHNDSNPSLAVYRDKVNPEIWLFKCMSQCQKATGDVIAFVSRFDRCTFSDALSRIAKESGQESEPEESTTKEATEAEIKQAGEYLIQRGIPVDWAIRYFPRGIKIESVFPLGASVGFVYDCDERVIKYRAINPPDKNNKFRHAKGHHSDDLLYNIRHAEHELATTPDVFADTRIFVVESERDCLTMEAQGFIAVSVSSATACLTGDKLKIKDDLLQTLAKADHVLIAVDQDPAGEKCAAAFESCEIFNANQVKRVKWQYRGKRFHDPKDIGELYSQNPTGFHDLMEQLADEAIARPPKWRQQFKTIAELDNRDIIQLIEGFMTEGNIGIGGLSFAGKTWLAMSISHALVTKQKLWGHFNVPEVHPVLYLCPEVGARQFRKRIECFKDMPVNDDSLFMCRTLSDGPTLPLDHPFVLEAVHQLGSPVVILDTAIRFSRAKDESSAADNLWMEQAVRTLREAGAIAVLLLHHSPKSAANEKKFIPTLENTFRGTGDIGALFDVAYNVRLDRALEKATRVTQVTVTCVKGRDLDSAQPFNLGLKGVDQEGQVFSFLERNGDLAWIAEADPMPVPKPKKPEGKGLEEAFVDAVTTNRKASYSEVAEILDISKPSAQKIAIRLGWSKPDGIWVKEAEECERVVI
jgi:AAA domain/CHC2 zinc finger/Toprim domain